MTYPVLELLIDGRWIGLAHRTGEEVVNPATDEVLGLLPYADAADLDAALEAAQRGFVIWKRTTPVERAAILRRAADLVRARKEELATLVTLEQGKPLADARGEVEATANVIEWSAEQGRRVYGRVIASRLPATRGMVVHEPVGPVAAFAPWNAPVMLSARKIAEALAAGCSIIIKPAEEAPACVLALARAFVDAGVPNGVLNMVFGVPSRVSEHLIASPIIRKITFTGSVPVGRHLARLAANGVKRISLELGGHAPVLVFDDVDVDKVAELAVVAKHRNAGQLCITPSRFYVHENIHDAFVTRVAELSGRLTVGNGLDAATQMGPLTHPRRIAAMESLVADARSVGATVRTGGESIGTRGHFFAPTVLTDVPPHAAIQTVEPFGPISPIMAFRSLDEVLDRANAVNVGLASYIFSNTPRIITAASSEIEAGLVAVNSFAVNAPETPFGGVKETGNGSEGGEEGLGAYLTTKFINETFV